MMNSTTARMLSRAIEQDLRRAAAERRRFMEPEIFERPPRRVRIDIWALIGRLPRLTLPRFSHPRFNTAL